MPVFTPPRRGPALCRAVAGTRPAKAPAMIQMHSRPKEQREAIRNLVHLVLTRDMATFNPDRFKDWVKDLDGRFRKVGLVLLFEIRSRPFLFPIKGAPPRRIAFNFAAATRVPFDDR